MLLIEIERINLITLELVAKPDLKPNKIVFFSKLLFFVVVAVDESNFDCFKLES
jgi:hypothetical protein